MCVCIVDKSTYSSMYSIVCRVCGESVVCIGMWCECVVCTGLVWVGVYAGMYSVCMCVSDGLAKYSTACIKIINVLFQFIYYKFVELPTALVNKTLS